MTGDKKNKFLRYLSFLFFLCMIAAIVVPLFMSGDQQNDFKCVYAAANAQNSGLNPYDTSNLSRTLGTSIDRPFLYPPLTLIVFRAFTALPLQPAASLFLAIKLIALCALLFLWEKIFQFKKYFPLLI